MAELVEEDAKETECKDTKGITHLPIVNTLLCSLEKAIDRAPQIAYFSPVVVSTPYTPYPHTITIGNVIVESNDKTFIDNLTLENYAILTFYAFEEAKNKGTIVDGRFYDDIILETTNIKIADIQAIEAEVKALKRNSFVFTSNNWVNCPCIKFQEVWKKECLSTTYMVRLICKSCKYLRLNEDGDPTIQQPRLIVYNPTQDWADCKHNVLLRVGDQTRRVIMGLGPSGCGKSTIAIQLFGCHKEIEYVWFIDGGISREESIAWRSAVLSVDKSSGIEGIANLYKMFHRIRKSKDDVFDFIKLFKVSMYIPETLAGFNAANSMMATTIARSYRANIRKYKIYDADWIGLLIFQHLNSSTRNCPFPEGYKCSGCNIKAKEREKSEGKMYSSNAYNASLVIGFNTIMKSNKQYIIHNSGGEKGQKTFLLTNKEELAECANTNGKGKLLAVFEQNIPTDVFKCIEFMETSITSMKGGSRKITFNVKSKKRKNRRNQIHTLRKQVFN